MVCTSTFTPTPSAPSSLVASLILPLVSQIVFASSTGDAKSFLALSVSAWISTKVRYLSSSWLRRFTSSSRAKNSTSRTVPLSSDAARNSRWSSNSDWPVGEMNTSESEVGGHETMLRRPGVWGIETGVSAWVQ